jgi:hypothetical protein
MIFVHHFENQQVSANGKAFGDAGSGQAMVADLLNVHSYQF